MPKVFLDYEQKRILEKLVIGFLTPGGDNLPGVTAQKIADEATRVLGFPISAKRIEVLKANLRNREGFQRDMQEEQATLQRLIQEIREMSGRMERLEGKLHMLAQALGVDIATPIQRNGEG